ncbi:unnamed protein product [marine sediment metagenome]|uniref:Uncharacterized protein n=1 Tax=marine sediment metagenome TaxID=412755 RepID=X0SZW8_9ZZZZ
MIINDCYNTKCIYWRKKSFCKKYLKTEDCGFRIATEKTIVGDKHKPNFI